MKRFLNALAADIKFQYRQGFYLVYLLLIIVYIVVIYQLGPKAISIVVPVIIFSDPSLVGFFFIGGLVLLERQQGITGYIGITPVTTGEYMWSKIISMVLLAVVTSLGIAIISGAAFNLILMVIGVVLTTIFFTLLGFRAVATCRTMNDYFIKMIPYILIMVMPGVGLINKPWAVIFRFTPTFAGLRIMLDSFGEVSLGRSILDISIIVIWCVALYFPIKKKFDEKAIRGE